MPGVAPVSEYGLVTFVLYADDGRVVVVLRYRSYRVAPLTAPHEIFTLLESVVVTEEMTGAAGATSPPDCEIVKVTVLDAPLRVIVPVRAEPSFLPTTKPNTPLPVDEVR